MNLPGLSMDSVTKDKAAAIERDYKIRRRGKDPREEEAKKEEAKMRRRPAAAAAAAAPMPKLTASEKNKIVDTMTQKRTEDENKKRFAKLRKIRRYHEEFPHLLGPPPSKLSALSEMAVIDAALEHCRHTMSSKNAAKQVRQLPIVAAKGVEWAVQQGYDPMGWGDKAHGLANTMQEAIHTGEMETALTELCIELEDWASTPAWFRFASQFFLICNMHVLGQRAREKMAEAANNPNVSEKMQEAMRRMQEAAERIRRQQQREEAENAGEQQ